MSNLRFKVGDLARIIDTQFPELMGLIVTIESLRTHDGCDYEIGWNGSNDFAARFGKRHVTANDAWLAPYPDPSNWDSFERETGLPRLTGKVKEEDHV